MNPSGTFPKDSKSRRVGRVNSRQFHVVGKLVGRDSLQKQLSRIRVFAFVALERHFAKPEANQAEKHDYEQEHGNV